MFKDGFMEDGTLTIGTLDVSKGIIREGVSLVGWESIDDCKGDECYAAFRCDQPKNGKCAVQVKYIQEVCNMVFKNYGYLDEKGWFKIGMHLLPLYSQLCKMKIIESGIKDMACVNNKGGIYIHPIYKEIRDTIKCILSVSEDLNVFVKELPIADFKSDAKNPKKERGDPGYYGRIGTIETKEGVVR
jgi:hypothetical protein